MSRGLTLPGVRSSFANQANQHMRGATGARGMMRPGQKTEMTPPDPTIGGSLQAGMGGGLAGYQAGTMVGANLSASAAAGGATAAEAAAAGSSAGPWGAAIGAVAGMASYLLS